MDVVGPRAELPRFLRRQVEDALADTRVVGIVGPRQAGKSTLVLDIVAGTPGAVYVSLDDRDARAAAIADPVGFVEGRPGMLAIDEVQRVPELLLAIKSTVDRDRRPGRFLVTGSSQLSANRGVSETLSGRIERLTLWPFTQDELAGRRSGFLEHLLEATLPDAFAGGLSKRDYLERAADPATGHPGRRGCVVNSTPPTFSATSTSVASSSRRRTSPRGLITRHQADHQVGPTRIVAEFYVMAVEDVDDHTSNSATIWRRPQWRRPPSHRANTPMRSHPPPTDFRC